MSITVRFFASLRETVGVDTLELPCKESIDGLLLGLQGLLSESAYKAICAENVRLALNQELITRSTPLKDGDEVAFLPPITGG